MEKRLNDAILKAASETLLALGGEPVEPLAHQRTDGASTPDVSVVISLVGTLNGAFVFRCTREYACVLAGNMLGMPVERDSEDLQDAIGEVHNMIVGAIKRYLVDSGDPYTMSVPTTIVGSDYALHIPSSAATKKGIVQFAVGEHTLGIEVYLES